MKMFMLDIETTNTTNFLEEDILQIGILELTQNSENFWVPGKSLSIDLPTKRSPRNDWDRENLGLLFKRCQQVPPTTPEKVRRQILDFFASCGKSSLVKLCGFNATVMDIPFMVAKGYLFPTTRDDQNKIYGDYHYRVYEISGSLDMAQDVLQQPNRNKLTEDAIGAYPEIALPEGLKSHDALYDCYRQTRLINGLVRLLRQKEAA